jgi:dipeptidyl aminopeptidase/acylaminoacyl peptidase
VFAALVVLGASAGALPADAAYPGKNGRIFFQKMTTVKDGVYEIHSVLPDGSGEVVVTSGPGRDYDPSVSADGTRVAFTRSGGDSDVWVVGADGSDPRQLTNTPAFHESDPAISPDGRRVYFSRRPVENRNYTSDVYAIGADGTGDPRLIATGAATPILAPDGTRFVAAGPADGGEGIALAVYELDASGGVTGRRELTTFGSDVEEVELIDITPEGSRVLYTRSGRGFGVFTIALDGGNPVRHGLPTFSGGGSFSPDGRSLVYGTHEGAFMHLFVTDAEGDARGRQLTSDGNYYSPDWAVAVPDTTAPVATSLAVPGSLRAGRIARRGVPVRLETNEAATARITLLGPRSLVAGGASALSTIGTLRASLEAGEPTKLRVHPSRRAKRGLRSLTRRVRLTVRVTLRDAAGNRRTLPARRIRVTP